MRMQRAAVVVAALCGVLAVGLPSQAAVGTQVTTGTQHVGSGQWGAAPSTTSLPFGAQGVRQIFFSVTNTGTLALTGATYTISGSGFKTGMSLSLLACVGGSWIVSTGVCSGGFVQTIVSTTGAATGFSVASAGLLPAAVGASVTLEAQLDKAPARTTVGSVTVTVDRSQVRAATVTNG